MVSEIYKNCAHKGLQPSLFHYREARGPEIDLLREDGQDLTAIEIKSGAPLNEAFFKNLIRFSKRLRGGGILHTVHLHLVYGGTDSQQRSHAQVQSWRDVHRVLNPINRVP